MSDEVPKKPEIHVLPNGKFGVFIGRGISVRREFTTVADALAAAVSQLPAGSPYCRQCAGYAISRRWDGKGALLVCEACNGTGAAPR